MIKIVTIIGGITISVGVLLGITWLFKRIKSFIETYIKQIVINYLKDLQK